MKRTITLFLFMTTLFQGLAQEEFYDIGKIQDIRIIFHEKNWKHVMDSVFTASEGNDRWMCDIRINGQLLENVGIRYKGYSSVNLNDIKNPFNIDLADAQHHKNYEGFTSLRLSNVNYDPSFVREALSYEIARKYLPASRANFATVYVNDTLLGLYSNVEAVNKDFIMRFFSGKGNSFIKGSPETLEYPFGQNANLADTHGADSTGYKAYYELESDYGWADLYHFISVLNQQPDSVAQVLNIDRALWMHAFNYAMLNLDSYIGYSQNYYMYKDDNGAFNMIPWDMNMSFGSFRHSDGSYHFNGLTIPQTKMLNPLGLMDFAISPRPLVTKLLKNDTLKRMFMAHIRTIVDENLSNGDYYDRGEFIQELIDSAVKQDNNKLYSYDYFRENLTNTVGNSGSADEFPGIKDLIEARVAYLSSFPGIQGAPVILEQRHDPELPVRGRQTWIGMHVTGASRVLLGYRFHSSDAFKIVSMVDDGNHHDSIAGDGIYGADFLLTGPVIQYYFYAENDSAGDFSPARAEYVYYSIQPMINRGDLVINEVNTATSVSDITRDSNPEYWIELLNTTSEDIHLKGFYLSDEKSVPEKWNFPDTIILAKKYLLLLAGNDASQGIHTNFTLPGSKGELWLSNNGNVFIDSVIWGQQAGGKSIGRYPNGYGTFTFMEPSPLQYNFIGTAPGSDFIIYPNPASKTINIEFRNLNRSFTVEIANTLGQVVFSHTYSSNLESIPVTVVPLDISGFGKGMYVMKLECNDQVSTKKFVVY